MFTVNFTDDLLGKVNQEAFYKIDDADNRAKELAKEGWRFVSVTHSEVSIGLLGIFAWPESDWGPNPKPGQ